MEYVCVGVGTGTTADAHRAFLLAYANAHTIPVNDCQGGYVCVGVGDGASRHRQTIVAYGEAHGLQVKNSLTPCPQEPDTAPEAASAPVKGKKGTGATA